jgi:hypothetical protein
MTVYQSIWVTSCRAGAMLRECTCTCMGYILYLLGYAKVLLPCCVMWKRGGLTIVQKVIHVLYTNYK